MFFPTRSSSLIVLKPSELINEIYALLSSGFATRIITFCYPEEPNVMHSTMVLTKTSVFLVGVRYDNKQMK